MTDYERGRQDATREILKTWFTFRNSGRIHEFDRADIVDAGLGISASERDDSWQNPYNLFVE